MKSVKDLPKAQFHVRLKEALGSDKEYYSLLRKQLDAVRQAAGQFLNINPILVNLRIVGADVHQLLTNTYRANHSAPLEIYIAPSGDPTAWDILQRNQTNILETAYKLENSLKKVKVHFNLNEPYVKDGIKIDDQFGRVYYQSSKIRENDYRKILILLKQIPHTVSSYHTLSQIMIYIDNFHDRDLCNMGLRISTNQRLNDTHVALSELLASLKTKNIHRDIWDSTQKFIDIIRSEEHKDTYFKSLIHAMLNRISTVYHHLLDHKALFDNDRDLSLDYHAIQSFQQKLLAFQTDAIKDKSEWAKELDVAKRSFLDSTEISPTQLHRILSFSPPATIQPSVPVDDITKEIQKRFAWYMLKMLSTDNTSELPPYEATLKTYAQASDEEKKSAESLIKHIPSNINAKSVKNTVDHYVKIFKLLRAIKLSDDQNKSCAQFFILASGHGSPMPTTDYMNSMHDILRFMLTFLEHANMTTETVAVIQRFIAALQGQAAENIAFRKLLTESLEDVRNIRENHNGVTFDLFPDINQLTPEDLKDIVALHLTGCAKGLATRPESFMQDSESACSDNTISALIGVIHEEEYLCLKKQPAYKIMKSTLSDFSSMSDAKIAMSNNLFFVQSFKKISQKPNIHNRRNDVFRLIVATDARLKPTSKRFENAAALIITASAFLRAWDLADNLVKSRQSPAFINAASDVYTLLINKKELADLNARFDKEVLPRSNTTSVSQSALVLNQNNTTKKKIAEPTNITTASAKLT